MSGFAIIESIKVLTQNGECEIELCLGDITKLTQEEKVDVLMVSAFSGDYSPSSTSVISALKRNLGLSVRRLARDKEEDLRKRYSCWWSKPLPSYLPYKRLLCFETNDLEEPKHSQGFGLHHRKGLAVDPIRGPIATPWTQHYVSAIRFSPSQPQVMIRDAFRCLVPILNNEDGSVVTPLLNTGDQGYEKYVMMKGMVEAAVRWMKAGLPLRKLKIVLYAPEVEGDDKAAAFMLQKYRITLMIFEQMKEKYDMQYMMPKEVPLEFDIYLSYSEADSDIVQKIQEKLKKNKEDVCIFSTRQQLDQNVFWQEDMYEAMMKSAKVIAVLSPNYLQNSACIEQYNIALCCNRQTHRDMLAPFYVVTIQELPTYMQLVQSIECRSQDEESINSACYQVIASLSGNFTRMISTLHPQVLQYDVFLSYSHKDSEIAQKMVRMLHDMNPELKIFFDVQEIKTGKSWQRAMYHSIDGSRCLVALMTNNYIQSAVCQEEFNLAMMKHYSQMNRLQLIPFVVDKISCTLHGYEKIPKIATTTSSLEDDLKMLCQALVTWLDKGELSEEESLYQAYFNSSEKNFELSEEWEVLRRRHFEEKFSDALNTSSLVDFPPTFTDAFSRKEEGSSHETCDIVLSYNKDDKEYAEFVMNLIQHFAPKLNIQAKGKNDQERLSRIEGGKKIVPLLSPSYIESPEQVEELHIAIWRSRLSPNLIFPIHLHILPPRPAYFHLLPCPVNLNDALWTELDLKHLVVLPDNVEAVVNGLSKTSEEIALFMAVYYLLETIKQERSESIPKLSSPLPALLNPFCLDMNMRRSAPERNGLATKGRSGSGALGLLRHIVHH